MVKNFYIFRNGQSSSNLDNKVQGCDNNSVLTDKGIHQAYAAADFLKNKNIEIVIASPLRRTRQTGTIVAKKIEAPLQLDARLKEVDLGEANGMPQQSLSKKFKNTYEKWLSNNPQNIDTRFADGESKKEVRQRILTALNDYVKSPYKNIAIAGHQMSLLETLQALHIEKNEVANGEIIHLQYDQNNWTYIAS